MDTDDSTIAQLHEAINTSRNERQKSMLIIELMHAVLARSERLKAESAALIRDFNIHQN